MRYITLEPTAITALTIGTTFIAFNKEEKSSGFAIQPPY
jgi:hypothetical protein